MKGKKCHSILVLLLVGVSLLLQSTLLIKNTNAISYSENLIHKETISVGRWICHYHTSADSTDRTTSDPCRIPASSSSGANTMTRYVDYMVSNGTANFEKDKYYELRILTAIEPYSANIPEQQIYPLTGLFYLPNSQGDADFVVKDVRVMWKSQETQSSYRTYYSGLPGSSASTQYPMPYTVDYYPQQIVEYVIMFKPRNNANNIHMQFGRPSTSSFLWRFPPSNISILDSQGNAVPYAPQILIYPSNLVEVYESAGQSQEEVAEKELEDRDNIESQQSDTENEATDSSEDIGTATTSLTGVVNTFLGNLQNLNANQCTLPEITAYGFSLGQLNLCTFQPPNWVQSISSAVVSLITLGLALHLFKRIMAIAKGLSGSK